MKRVQRLAQVVGLIVASVSLDAGAQTAAQPLPVGVFADQYIVAGRSYEDLDELEGAVRRTGASGVRLDACGAPDSTAQRAAAHRFRDLYLEMHVFDRGAPVCSSYLAAYLLPARARSGEEPTGIDKAAVDAWWHALMP
jgi:hypothetical protein